MKKQLFQASLILAALIAGAFAVSAAQQVPRPQLAPQTKWKLDPKLERELAPAVRQKVRRCLDLPTVGECDECVAKATKRAELFSIPFFLKTSNSGGDGVSQSSQLLLASCSSWNRI